MRHAKRIYWRPRGVSRTVMMLISLLALVSLAGVEHLRVTRQQPFYKEKMRSAQLAREAMKAIKSARENHNLPIDHETDPSLSGLIGALMTPVTSNTGSLPAKQISVNPNFAAVIVQMLRKAGVRPGDTVAVGCSGSFPALNVCVYAALETLRAKPIVISSVAASQWGANHPDFLWIDMEKILVDAKFFSFRSVAASIGGVEDRGLGLSAEGRQMIRTGIERNGLAMINVRNFAESIGRRTNLYREHAGDEPIKAYISIGGGTTSVGTRLGKRLFRPGLNFREPSAVMPADSVMSRFIDQGIPGIHLIRVQELAERYGLTAQPSAIIPPVGEGEIFRRSEYNPWLAGGALVVIVLSLLAFVRLDWGYRIFGTGLLRRRRVEHPEPMV